MIAVEVRNLSYVYDVNANKKSLDGVNLKIEKGEYVCLIGKTGSGKTTLAESFALILRPTGGQVLFGGVDVWQNKGYRVQIRRQIGLIFQFAHHQLFAETVEDDIAFGPRQLGFDEFEVQNRVLEAALLVGIDRNLFKKSPFELSGGQQKRVAIAGVLAMKPRILILDEPTVGVDPVGRAQILNIIRRYHDSEGCTTIHVTHDMNEVVKVADSVVLISEGKVFCHKTTREFFEQVEVLKKMGFDVPQMVDVFYRLRKRGFENLPVDVFNVEKAFDLISEMVLGKEKKV